MKDQRFIQVLACVLAGVCMAFSATAQKLVVAHEGVPAVVPSRVVEHVDESKLVTLTGNTHPAAVAQNDRGRVEQDKLLEKMVLVLQRSPEQEAALAAFNERQYDPKSADFHHWLHAEEFGRLYGPSDSDLTQVTSWLQNHGFRIDLVTKGRVTIQFTGTVGQVEQAFHLEMHNYFAEGKMHISNDRDPSIPAALSPVVQGITSLNDFRPIHFSHPGAYVKRDLKTGKYTRLDSDPERRRLQLASSDSEDMAPTAPGYKANADAKHGVHSEFGYLDAESGTVREELSPYDVATIYNILPLWNASTPINGTGVKVAIVALSDVVTSDFNTFRSSFGLPASTFTTLHSGADPGLTGSQGENTEDTEMVSATAPGASIILVADVNNTTTDGLQTSVTYIVDNEIAPILTMSYGVCELKMGSALNAAYNGIFQQAATAGISAFVAAGDSGSSVCTSQNGTAPPYGDSYGLAVSGMASTPYVTAVGGTDLQWPWVYATNPFTDYWNTTNAANGSSAKGYMPEMSWNDTCTNPFLLLYYTGFTSNEEICNAAITELPGLVEMASGGGGVSNCTTPSGSTISTCAGGYAKPSWQTGVTGIPADGHRDLPDVSMFAAYGFQDSTDLPGSALLICESQTDPDTNGCDYTNPDYIIYQENGGTSAASPMTAGIMAMVVQKTGSPQGLANPMFYKLASEENYSACNSNTVQPGNACIFYDTTSGSNAMNCYTGDPDCVTNTSGDQAGILSGYSAGTGYDLTTGLGSFNVANLVNAWASVGGTPSVTVGPSSLTFSSTGVGVASAAQNITIKNTNSALTPVIVSSVTLTGADQSAFDSGLATTCPLNGDAGWALNSGVSCTFSFKFTPTATGTQTATVNFYDNASGGHQTVALSGSIASSGTPATMSSPTPSGTLSGSAVTFSWTAGTNVTAYFLSIGNTGVGSKNLYNPGATEARTAAVTGLPTDAETIYVRLGSKINGTWQTEDYTYKTASIASVMVSPTPGSEFASTSVTFDWSAIGTSDAYFLSVGNDGVGGKNLYAGAATTATSATVTGLPDNGETIYVRVGSKISGVWHTNDYTYTASVVPAALTTPTPGSTLSGAAVTFDWSAGTDVTEYFLSLGSTGVGSHNLYSGAATTARSAAVTGLPTNGETIYARLGSKINGVWHSVDYTYKAE